MPKANLRCKKCSHEFEGEYHSLRDEIECPSCKKKGQIFGSIQFRSFIILDSKDGYKTTLGMLKDVIDFHLKSGYHSKKLQEFLEDRIGVHMEKTGKSLVFEKDNGMRISFNEVLALLISDEATRREVYSIWMGISR